MSIRNPPNPNNRLERLRQAWIYRGFSGEISIACFLEIPYSLRTEPDSVVWSLHMDSFVRSYALRLGMSEEWFLRGTGEMRSKSHAAWFDVQSKLCSSLRCAGRPIEELSAYGPRRFIERDPRDHLFEALLGFGEKHNKTPYDMVLRSSVNAAYSLVVDHRHNAADQEMAQQLIADLKDDRKLLFRLHTVGGKNPDENRLKDCMRALKLAECIVQRVGMNLMQENEIESELSRTMLAKDTSNSSSQIKGITPQ
jgi:hypothetical protein